MEGGELFSRIQERGDQAFTERGLCGPGTSEELVLVREGYTRVAMRYWARPAPR